VLGDRQERYAPAHQGAKKCNPRVSVSRMIGCDVAACPHVCMKKEKVAIRDTHSQLGTSKDFILIFYYTYEKETIVIGRRQILLCPNTTNTFRLFG
jgi:hypothetical protein